MRSAFEIHSSQQAVQAFFGLQDWLHCFWSRYRCGIHCVGRESLSHTVKEETVDDALVAVGALSSEKKIDTSKIFVLGHSLGGSVLPRIGQGNHAIAGFICLAGSTRPLEDIVLEQVRYVLSLNGKPSEEQQEKLKELGQQVARVKSPTLSEKTRGANCRWAFPPAIGSICENMILPQQPPNCRSECCFCKASGTIR